MGRISEETKAKMSASHQRRKKLLGYMNSPETRRKISRSLTGKKVSEETKKKLRSINLGKKHTEETKEKMRISHTGKWAGENNPNWGKRGSETSQWNGGTRPVIEQIRKCFLYRQWRSDIFTRDDFTCQKCNHRGGYLHAHHIKSFNFIIELNDITTLIRAEYCDELWNINNGVTLCKRCHKERHKKHEQTHSSE